MHSITPYYSSREHPHNPYPTANYLNNTLSLIRGFKDVKIEPSPTPTGDYSNNYR
jgi:hypothetical protein